MRLTQGVTSRVKIFDFTGRFIREITPPGLGSLSSLSGVLENNEGFFSFSSYHVPPTIYRYDIASGKQEIWHQRKVPFDSNKYESDGTKVPMILAHAKGIALNGSNPVLLGGYGGFNISSPRAFNDDTDELSFLFWQLGVEPASPSTVVTTASR